MAPRTVRASAASRLLNGVITGRGAIGCANLSGINVGQSARPHHQKYVAQPQVNRGRPELATADYRRHNQFALGHALQYRSFDQCAHAASPSFAPCIDQSHAAAAIPSRRACSTGETACVVPAESAVALTLSATCQPANKICRKSTFRFTGFSEPLRSEPQGGMRSSSIRTKCESVSSSGIA